MIIRNKILLHCVCLQMLCWSIFLVPKRVSQCYWHTKILCFEENVLKIQQMWQFFARLTKNGKFLFWSGGICIWGKNAEMKLRERILKFMTTHTHRIGQKYLPFCHVQKVRSLGGTHRWSRWWTLISVSLLSLLCCGYAAAISRAYVDQVVSTDPLFS